MPRAPLALLSLALLAGCAAPQDAPAPEVVGTFYPLAFAAQRLGGDNVTAGALVPPGIEPHDWEPTASDVARLSGARLVLAQGAGFEPWLDGLLANLGADGPRVVETTSTIQLAPHEEHEGEEEPGHDESEVDPHTWIAPSTYARQVEHAGRAMVTAFPDHAPAIEARQAALVGELDALQREYDAGLKTCEARVIIANHDAYGYLARHHDFEVVALSGLSPEAEPTPDAIARAVDVAREHNLTIVFFEELVTPRVAEIVAKEVGAQTRVLSPIEGAPAEGDVLTLMRANLVALREAMRCT